MKCFFEQYSNSGFFLEQETLHIFSFVDKTWKEIKMLTNGISLSDGAIVLDHITVTFYGIYKGLVYYCPIDTKSTILEWKILKQSEIKDSEVVIGFGQNHQLLIILFL